MAIYLVNVELFGNPSSADLVILERSMESHGFLCTTQGDDSVVYDLPRCTFKRETSIVTSIIMQEAKAAVRTVWSDSSVLVSQVTGSIFNGLRRREPHYVITPDLKNGCSTLELNSYPAD